MQCKVPHIWINDSGVDPHTSRHRAPHPCRRWALNSVHQSSAHLLNQASLLFGRLFSDVLLQDGVEGSSQGAQQHGRRAVRHSRSGHAPHRNAQHETARYQGKSATAESQGWSLKYWGPLSNSSGEVHGIGQQTGSTPVQQPEPIRVGHRNGIESGLFVFYSTRAAMTRHA